MNVLEEINKLGELTWDQKVALVAYRLRQAEKAMKGRAVFTLSHRFEPGLYIRTMTLPADTVFIGRKHLRGHEVHLISGKATYVTGKGKFDVVAPFSIFTAPGFAMVAYIHEEGLVETWHSNLESSEILMH